MKHRFRQTDNFREDILIDEIANFSWGIHTKLSLKSEEDRQISKCMFYVPIFDVLGENIKCKKVNGLWLKFFKADKSNRNDKILIKLKVCTVVEEPSEENPDEVKDVDYNLEFNVDCFKTITIMDSKSKDQESNKFKEFYFVTKYFPEVYRLYKRDITSEKYEVKTTRVKSPLWNKDILKNAIMPSLMFRIVGEVNMGQYRIFAQEFESIINTTGVYFVKTPPEIEDNIKSNILKMMNGEEPYDKFKKTLLRLPFNILYNILCLFSQKIIHLLSYSYQELLEAVEYIEEFCDSEEFRDKIRNLEYILMVLKTRGYGSTESLKDRIKKEIDDYQGYKGGKNLDKTIPVRRVVITPTCVYYKFPTRNMPNRVIRNFKKHTDDFIRVSFQGEDQRCQRYNKENNAPLLEHIEKIMNKGIKISNK